MALAVCAVLWSDPAFAALACAYTPGCPQHTTQVRRATPINPLPIIADSKPCCPAHHAPAKSPMDTPSCCASDDSGATLPAASFSSYNPRPRQALALLTATLFACPALDIHSSWLAAETTASYVKPVTQKKTDLRI